MGIETRLKRAEQRAIVTPIPLPEKLPFDYARFERTFHSFMNDLRGQLGEQEIERRMAQWTDGLQRVNRMREEVR